MVFKRYIKKKGKKFGPYYYESYRDEKGVVRKRYIGTEESGKESSKVAPHIDRKFLWLFGIFLLIICILALLYSYETGISGLVVSGVSSMSRPVSMISGFAVSDEVNKQEVSIATEKLEKKFNKKIEVHFFTRDFYNNKKDPLVKEILRDGVKLI